jgi:hypothetical protein
MSLLATAISNNLSVVRSCLEAGVGVNSVNEKKKTAAMIGAQYGHVELVPIGRRYCFMSIPGDRVARVTFPGFHRWNL